MRDSLLLLNVRERRRLVGDRNFWRWAVKEAMGRCGLSRNLIIIIIIIIIITGWR
jgi:hypothetical protein